MTKRYEQYLELKEKFDKYEQETYDFILNRIYYLMPYFNFQGLCRNIGVNSNSFHTCSKRNPSHPLNLNMIDPILTGMENCLQIDKQKSFNVRWNYIIQNYKFYNVRKICDDANVDFARISVRIRNGRIDELTEVELERIECLLLRLRDFEPEIN